jgi:hypothetical protein
MCCTWALSALPLPTTACLISRGVYSATGSSWMTAGADGGAAGLAELEGGIGIARHEHPLDGHLVGLEFAHQRGEVGEDHAQLVRQGRPLTRRQPLLT